MGPEATLGIVVQSNCRHGENAFEFPLSGNETRLRRDPTWVRDDLFEIVIVLEL